MILPDIDMDAFRRGDEREYTKIFNSFYAPLNYFATQLVGEENDGEDIVMTVFEKLWKKRGGFSGVNKIKAFLYISIRNACFNRLRAVNVRYLGHNEIKHLSGSLYQDFVFGTMVKSELLYNVYIRIKELSPQQRQIIKLKVVEDKSNVEVADLLNLSVSTIKTQYWRALKHLRKDLA